MDNAPIAAVVGDVLFYQQNPDLSISSKSKSCTTTGILQNVNDVNGNQFNADYIVAYGTDEHLVTKIEERLKVINDTQLRLFCSFVLFKLSSLIALSNFSPIYS